MFENVPYKLAVSDVLQSRPVGLTDIRTLKLNDGRGRLKVLQMNYVWLQGRIVHIFKTSDKVSLKLKDETGTVGITYIGNTELPWLTPGVYCSAVGKIKQDGEVIAVEAVKMTNLSRNPVFERMWPYEVREVKLLLLGLIEPSLTPYEEED